MAECSMRYDEALIFGLDIVEMDTLRLHARRNELCVTDAAADLMERGLQSVAEEILQEESSTSLSPDGLMGIVTCDIHWPTDGPYTVFEEADKRFVASVLAMSLREALTVILYKKAQEEKRNVMERSDEEDGTGEPDVSQH